jgi:type VI secretion system protein ImpA
MDLEPFLVPVADGGASGSELRNDPRFHAVERLMEPAARSVRLENVRSGGTGSVNIDWTDILAQSADLAATGRDLRLLAIVVRALANAEGFDGLAQGLDLLTTTIEHQWDTVHPALRESPSPSEAARRRTNAILDLQNRENGLLCDLEFTVVLTPRGLGAVTVGDLAAAALTRMQAQMELPQGLGEKELAEILSQHEARVNRVTTACRATAAERPDDLAELLRAIGAARSALAALEAALTARVGENGISFKLPELDKALSRAMAPLAAAQGQAVPTAIAPEVTAMAEPAARAPVTNGAHPPPTSGGIPGSVNSRRDVERCLDMIIDFYERTEPSSPIPHLARRMRKMVPMNFLQLMEEIAPSGMKEFKNVAGVDDKKSAAQ